MVSRILMTSVAILSSVPLLGGCSSWSYSPSMRGNMDIEGMSRGSLNEAAPKAPGTFTQSLASEYSGLANDVAKTPTTGASGDWGNADYFSRKGLQAQHGEAVPPENNANWLIPLEGTYGFRTQLADGRSRLVKALDAGGRAQTPALGARAQSRYDCWVWEMEKDWKTGSNGTCRAEFLAALDEMENPPKSGTTVPLEYNVYFEFNKSNLTPEARQIVDNVAGTAQRDSAASIELVGKADRSGTDPYNMKLSERRADTVRDALVADGLSADRIGVNWVGEREPPVPTADGVREPRNRVVTITVPTTAPVVSRAGPAISSGSSITPVSGTKFLSGSGPRSNDRQSGGGLSPPNMW
jgi:OmpA-OmpF porin, OOP family